MLRKFLDLNIVLSQRFDQLLPEDYRVDGNTYFFGHILPALIKPNTIVVDVGGGKNPVVSAESKKQLGITNIGIDIDGEELARAPAQAYDQTYTADICKIRLTLNGDTVICSSILEHVLSAQDAFAGLAAVTRHGGTLALFLPSRRAWFAKINLLLPEKLKRKILFTIFPHTERDQGFPAYYDRATIAEYKVLAERAGFSVVKVFPFYISSYFQFFFPLYFFWRMWIILARAVAGQAAAETFSMILKRE